MRKGSTKIIEIAGLRGIAVVLFIGVCLVAGFVMFPAKVLMNLWNTYASGYFAVANINIWQGLLLWAGVALSCYIANGKRFLVSFYQPPHLSEQEMKVLMERVRLQAKARKLNTMLMKPDELKEITTESENSELEVHSVSEEVNKKES